MTYTATVDATSGSATPAGSVEFTEGGSPVSCSGGSTSLSGVGEATCEVAYSTAGSHTITATYPGSAGFDASSDVLEQTVNLAAPTTSAELSGTAGTNGWYTSNVLVTLSSTPDGAPVASTEYSYTGGAPWTTYSAPFSITADGTHTLTFRSTDANGNVEGNKSQLVKVDKSVPVTSASLSGTAGSNGWYTSDVSVTLSTLADTSGVTSTEYSLAGGAPWTAYTVPFTLGEGQHTVTFRSTDAAGNVEGNKSQVVKVDKAAPTTSVGLSATAGTNGWYKSNVQVTLTTAADTSGVALTEYSLTGGAPWTTYAGPFTLSSNGIYTVTFRSTDTAGNVESDKTQLVKIDKDAPTTSAGLSGTAGTNGWYTSNVQVTLSTGADTSGVALTEYSLTGGAPWTTYTGPFSLTADGIHTVTIRSTDTAGNVESNKTQLVKIDKTAPAAPSTNPSTSGATNNNSGNSSWGKICLNNPKICVTPAADTSGTAGVTYALAGRTHANAGKCWVPGTGFVVAASAPRSRWRRWTSR